MLLQYAPLTAFMFFAPISKPLALVFANMFAPPAIFAESRFSRPVKSRIPFIEGNEPRCRHTLMEEVLVVQGWNAEA